MVRLTKALFEPAVTRREPELASHVVVLWLVRLRWVSTLALAGAAWAATTFWRVRLPVLPLVTMLAVLVATNAALAFQLRSLAPRRGVIGVALLVDAGVLTAILWLVGGPLNPFSIVYLIGITIAAVSLGHRWAIAIALVSNAAYGYIFFNHRPLEFSDEAFRSRVLPLHLGGMWVALAAASGLIAYFVGRVSESLAERERELTDARAAAARSDRLTALLSLGAGAAHELATPLSTIKTAAGELDRVVLRSGIAPIANDLVHVIGREVDRCATVLDQLSGRAASASAEDMRIPLSDLVDDLRYRLGDSLAARLRVELPPVSKPVAAPAEPLRQTLVALLRNAFDASPPDRQVTLRVVEHNGVRMEVIDHGRGMTPDELARAGEPFFTTKRPGGGLGLGLFLARAFADQMGGTLHLQSTPGQGTAIVLQLPAR